jgi:hypothetical protein
MKLVGVFAGIVEIVPLVGPTAGIAVGVGFAESWQVALGRRRAGCGDLAQSGADRRFELAEPEGLQQVRRRPECPRFWAGRQDARADDR